jgi:NADH:ubiquinone oxidoreductase subunit H
MSLKLFIAGEWSSPRGSSSFVHLAGLAQVVAIVEVLLCCMVLARHLTRLQVDDIWHWGWHG